MKANLLRIIILGVLGYLTYFAYHHPYFEYSQSYKLDPKTESGNFLLNRVNREIDDPLNRLTSIKFFRTYKGYIESPCPFYDAQMACSTQKCVVTPMETDLVYKDWKKGNMAFSMEKAVGQEQESGVVGRNLQEEEVIWMNDEDTESQAFFIDLFNNPEGFTGYNGTKVWSQIYKENANQVDFSIQCSEQSLLYKIISGLQSNINMHITQFWGDVHSDIHYADHHQFNQRVGAHKERVENLYFLYHFVLTAYDKLRSDIPDYTFTKYNKTENTLIKKEIKSLEKKLLSTDFDPLMESKLLTSVSREEFIAQVQPIFFNITQLINCVTCEKCKLHAKLQFSGLSAAMKLMFPDSGNSELTRNELVGFFNLLRKLSNSLEWYHKWVRYEEGAMENKQMLLYMIMFLSGLVFVFSFIVIGLVVDGDDGLPKQSRTLKGFKSA